MNSKTILLSLSFVFLSACTSLPSDRPSRTESFSVGSSVLSNDSVRIQQPSDPMAVTGVSPKKPTSVRVRTNSDLASSSPMLSEMPNFGTSQSSQISVSIDESAIPIFIQHVFGDLLALDFVISPDVERQRQTLSLRLREPVSKEKLYVIVRDLLDKSGIDLYCKENIVYISNRQGSTNSNKSIGIGAQVSDIPDTAGTIVQLIPFTFNSSRTISNIVTKLSSVQIYIDSEQRIIVAEGSRQEIERAVRIVQMLDVPNSKGRDVRILNLVYVSPDDLITQLRPLLESEGFVIGTDIALVPIPRLNAIVVYSSSTVLANRVESWFRLLDVSTGGDKERYFVYRPQYAKAEDMVKNLNRLIGNGSSQQSATASNATNPAQGQTTSANSDSQGSGGQSSGSSSLTVDKNQNAIIVKTTPAKYQEMLSLFSQLDKLPGQVSLQVVIAEVELSDNVKTGIDWFYDSTKNYEASGSGSLSSSGGLLSFTGFKGDWQMALSVMAKKTDMRVLSQPYLVVRDGESSSINSGKQVPIITQTSTNTDSDNVTNQVQYRSTGVSLTVTPTINADGIISLEISQETSKSEPTEGFEVATPTIISQTLATKVLAGDGRTVILGGLIKDDISNGSNKVPLLGDIPGVGRLFRTDAENTSRSELMILITPRIIRDTKELEEFGEKLSEAYSFPVEMNSIKQ